jgi:hypothetical protein
MYNKKQMLDFENQYLDAVFQQNPTSPLGRKIAEARKLRDQAIKDNDTEAIDKITFLLGQYELQKRQNRKAKENYLKGDVAIRRKNITSEILSEHFANFGEESHFGLLRKAKDVLHRDRFSKNNLSNKLAKLSLSTLGAMRRMLEGKGVTFDAAGNPKGDFKAESGIFVDPLTGENLITTPEVEHLLAQYVVSLDKFNNRLIIDKTGFDTVETASSLKDTKRSELTPEREKQLREIGWLEDFDAEDNPIFSTARNRNKQHREEVAKVIDILNANPDDTGEPKMWRKTKTKAGRDRWEAGVPSEKQMQALRNSDLDPSYVEKIEKIRNAILKGDGTIWGNDYYKAITGGKYDSRAKVKFSLIVPFALEATQAGNINIKAFNLSKLEQKIGNYADQRPAFFDAWNGDTDAFRRDIVDFFQGPNRGKLFPEGDRKDLIYQFLGIKNKQNPLSGEWVDNSRLIESNRIERSTNLNPYENLDKIPFDYGKALRREYMPEPNQQQGARLMPAPAEADYSAAVKQGDLAKAQELVNQAADAAGYDSPQLYHGSIEKELRKLDPKKAVEVEGGVFLSTNEDVAYDYTFERAYGDIISEEPLGDIVRARVKFNNPLEYKPKGKIVDAIEMGRAIKTAKEQGNDGLIIRDIDDTVQGSGDMGDVYVAFSPEQIKSNDPITRDNRGEIIPLNKRFDSQTEDIRFMPAPAEGENMVAVHNLTADNLRHSLKMGGIANPSMAILDVNKGGGFDSYGDITLVASKDLIDPKKGAKVFGADIYSPRYPDITVMMPKETRNKIEKYLEPYQNINDKYVEGSSIWNLEPNLETEGWRRSAQEHTGLQSAYLKEKGLMPEIAEGENASSKINQAARGNFDDFSKWVQDLPEREGWQFEEKIFRGFTPAGNRRYTPHTLDNVVKIMKRNIRGGESFNYGAGSVRAKAAPQFRSVAQIKKNRGKLTDPRSMERVKDEANSEMIELESELDPYLKQGMKSDNPFSDIFSYRLQEAAEIGVRSLRDYYEDGAPFEKVSSFLNKLKDLPSDYFEAKFPRAVQLEEFEAAIIPSDLDPKLKKVLEDRGLELREYDSSLKRNSTAMIDANRKEVLQKQTEEAGLRFMPQPTFYSKAERAVEGAKAGIFNKEGMTSVGQAKALLEKNAPETELEWSGVLDYLDLQKEEGNKVSKQDLLSYLKNNGVEVEEVYRSGSDTDTLREKYADQMLQRYEIDTDPDDPLAVNGYVAIDENGEMLRGFGGDVVRLEGSIIDAEAGLRDRLFDEALKMPDNELREIVEDRDLSGTEGPALFSPTEQFAGGPAVLPGGENYSELVLKLPDGSLKGGETEYFEVPSGHRFPEDNILAHVRFTERTDADGKRMLFLDEVQSDWNTDIRERGVKKERPESIQRERDELEAEGYKIMESDAYKNIDYSERKETLAEQLETVENIKLGWPDYPAYQDKKNNLTSKIAEIDKKIKETENKKYSDLYDTPEELLQHFADLNKRIEEIDTDFPKYPKGAPDMPYKGSKWQDLVMKRMIRWAADNGYDRLGWITGKDTADRYDLSKVINEIAIPTVEKDVRSIRLETGKGDSFKMMVDNEGKVDGAFKASQFNGKQLDEVIGKELAEKVMAFESPGSLTGTDLKVGGEWASNLYDKSLPKIAKKLTKKKGAVGRVGIYGSNGKLNGALAKNGIKPKYEANYVDISPEVKELAQEGFSYFMPEGRGGAASAPVQAAAPQPPSGVIIPKVKLTEDEKEESRKLLQQFLD